MDVETIRKSIKKDTPCPFGYGHHDLRGCNLTLFQKYWLGSRIVFKVSCASNLEKRFKLCQRTLVKYATSFDLLETWPWSSNFFR